MPTNFELERLKLKLDIFKIPENRVHELTDSNVSRIIRPAKKSIIKGRRFNINANGHFKAVRCIYAKTRHFLKRNGDLEFLHL